ncbi:MAG: FK506-binding protein 2A [Benjaminiella poitrasii]|nr:MAG: FK506-binding protein 2A [Benjaminiella poitrasii]
MFLKSELHFNEPLQHILISFIFLSCLSNLALMIFSVVYKVYILLALIMLVYANPELEMEQPTKLLGGVLKKSKDCKQKVSSVSTVKLHYRARAWGADDYYESTYEGEAHKYTLGKDKMIKGLEQGISGMCTGDIRRLLIPADLAYGNIGLPNLVPANSAVIYEVEMVDVKSPFTNPWFWLGLAGLAFAFIFGNRFTKMKDASKSAKFLEQKEQEKITKTE